ncbi:TIM barrel protein [candidate division KSB1 bacterium]|nr:TIM barrel protein [candidate division KSB1 bacterium]
MALSFTKNKNTKWPVRLGGPLFEEAESPERWIELHRQAGYRAALCPVEHPEEEQAINAYRKAARGADILIAEVGVWNNPISPNDAERKEALEKCIEQLELAEKIEALCCVNVSGSRSTEHWYGPHAQNLTDKTFDLIVETTRKIIDAVKPKKTFYALETLPWIFPHTVESYVRLIKAIDRPAFGVHCDPVNMITSPEKYFFNAQLLRDFFQKLGPHIKSCHAKDIILRNQLTTHLDEIRPGLGALDFNVYLQELARLEDVPLIIEHLQDQKEYERAAQHIRSVAEKNNLKVL